MVHQANIMMEKYMNRKWALIAFSLCDMFGIFMIWWGIQQTQQVYSGIATLADSITFQNRIGFAFSGILLPIIHLIGIGEYFWPKWVKMRIGSINRILVVTGIVVLSGGILFSIHLQDHVSNSEYQFCAEASGPGVIVKTLVYTKNEDVCRRLAN